MAALRAVLTALRRAVARDLETLWSIKVNNFFLFILLMLYSSAQSGVEPKAAEPLIAMLVLLMLFPASGDPLAKIPPSRMALWPLRAGQWAALRLASFLLSPVLWAMSLILWQTKRLSSALWFFAFAGGVQILMAAGIELSRFIPEANPLRHIPQFPGRWGGLIRNNVRELATVLDLYLALMLSIGGCCYRYLAKNPDPAAAPVLSILVALALSTYAQSLFGLELRAGMTRYALLPLKGWEVLIAKDIAFLAVLLILIIPLSVGPGLTFGLVALALGHHSSVYLKIEQKRWRFAGGRLMPVGAAQGVGGVVAAFAEKDHGAVVLIPAAVVWLGSLYFYGRVVGSR